MDYWQECISEAFEDAGLTASKEQIDTVASWVDGAHENYGMACGHDCIPNPLETENEELKCKYKKEVQKLEKRELDLRERAGEKIRDLQRRLVRAIEEKNS